MKPYLVIIIYHKVYLKGTVTNFNFTAPK